MGEWVRAKVSENSMLEVDCRYKEAWFATDVIVRKIVPSIIDLAIGFGDIASRLRDIPTITEHSSDTDKIVRELMVYAVKLRKEAESKSGWTVSERRNVRNAARDKVSIAIGKLENVAHNIYKQMTGNEICMLTELTKLIALSGLMVIEAEEVKHNG